MILMALTLKIDRVRYGVFPKEARSFLWDISNNYGGAGILPAIPTTMVAQASCLRLTWFLGDVYRQEARSRTITKLS